jgi:hypothetical protein
MDLELPRLNKRGLATDGDNAKKASSGSDKAANLSKYQVKPSSVQSKIREVDGQVLPDAPTLGRCTDAEQQYFGRCTDTKWAVEATIYIFQWYQYASKQQIQSAPCSTLARKRLGGQSEHAA